MNKQIIKSVIDLDNFIVKPNNKLKLSQIVGQEKAIAELSRIIQSFEYNTIYKYWKISLPKGLLFTGLPGTGKTFSARCLISELKSETIFVHLTYSDIASRWIGAEQETFKALMMQIDELSRKHLVVVFFDEIESFTPNRTMDLHTVYVQRVDAFLQWIDGGLTESNNLLVIGATNNPDLVDAAVRRPGRLGRIIEFVPLTAKNIPKAIMVHLEQTGIPNEQYSGINWKRIESALKGCQMTGAEVKELVNRVLENKLARTLKAFTESRKKQSAPITDAEQNKFLERLNASHKKITSDDVIKTLNANPMVRIAGGST